MGQVVNIIDAALSGDVEDINTVNDQTIEPGFSILHFAVAFRAPTAVVEALLRKGADVNAWAISKRNRFTVLHLAIRRFAGPKTVAVLLRNGADVAALTADSRSPLHYALSSNAGPETVFYLLLAGADARSYLPLAAVELRCSDEVLGLLLAAGAENQTFTAGVENRQPKLVLTHNQEEAALTAARESLGKAAVESLMCATPDFLKIFDPHSIQTEILDTYIDALPEENDTSKSFEQEAAATVHSMPIVEVQGCKGDYASKINGVYRPSGEIYNGKDLLVQTFDPDIVMRYVTFDDKNAWYISRRVDMEANNAEGYCRCITSVDNPAETYEALQWIVSGNLETKDPIEVALSMQRRLQVAGKDEKITVGKRSWYFCSPRRKELEMRWKDWNSRCSMHSKRHRRKSMLCRGSIK